MTDIFEKGDQPCPIEFNPICTCHYSFLKPIPGNTKYRMYQQFQSIKVSKLKNMFKATKHYFRLFDQFTGRETQFIYHITEASAWLGK